MTHEQLAAKMDAAIRAQERNHRFAAALWLLRRHPALQRTLRTIRRHVARAAAAGTAVSRAEIARSLGVPLTAYEQRFSRIVRLLGIRL